MSYCLIAHMYMQRVVHPCDLQVIGAEEHLPLNRTFRCQSAHLEGVHEKGAVVSKQAPCR